MMCIGKIIWTGVLAIKIGYYFLQAINFPVACKVKVKCTLVQSLRLCTGHTAHRGSRGIALLFLDHGTRRG